MLVEKEGYDYKITFFVVDDNDGDNVDDGEH